MMKKYKIVVLAGAMLWADHGVAQSLAPSSDTELSKETENPVTRQITIPLRYEGTLSDGADKAIKDTFEFDQAVVPFRLNDEWALITRTKLPLAVQPPKQEADHWATALDNGYTTFFLSPSYGQGFYWGLGPVLYYPAAGNQAVGVNRWGSGASVAFVKKDEGPWVIGAVVNNIWSIGGPPGSTDRTNSLLINPVVSYHFGGGWSLTSSPNVMTDWIASGGKWTVPVGGGFSKVLRLGPHPIKLGLEAYYNAIRPEAGQDTWLIDATLTFVFPRLSL